MSVAKCLGVDDVDGPEMRSAWASWPRWCASEPVLAVVDDLRSLPDWLRRAEPPDRDVVLSTLIRLRPDDANATVALVWLLTPGATLLAGRLRNLADDIECGLAAEHRRIVFSLDPRIDLGLLGEQDAQRLVDREQVGDALERVLRQLPSFLFPFEERRSRR